MVWGNLICKGPVVNVCLLPMRKSMSRGGVKELQLETTKAISFLYTVRTVRGY